MIFVERLALKKKMSWEQINLNIYEGRKMAENAFGKWSKYFSRFLTCSFMCDGPLTFIEAVVNKYQLTGSVGRALCLVHEG